MALLAEEMIPDFATVLRPALPSTAYAFVTLVNECANATLNDCDPAATCMDNPLSYECLCRESYLDVSSDPIKRPGRSDFRTIAVDCDNPFNTREYPSSKTALSENPTVNVHVRYETTEVQQRRDSEFLTKL
ncbi:hypothetical protein NECAME_05636 [Necator americanus]|uniref:EGF-like domain-containing protein n=1 Tax=Necator americanus TaxID=51031 RepID=W2SHZ9_NECAM|nr:hypothetical protein NECAME_05636 [Necator americanus]ETN68362.1 hypothetical protein NECAME_05636 [Necator americanus]